MKKLILAFTAACKDRRIADEKEATDFDKLLAKYEGSDEEKANDIAWIDANIQVQKNATLILLEIIRRAEGMKFDVTDLRAINADEIKREKYIWKVIQAGAIQKLK